MDQRAVVDMITKQVMERMGGAGPAPSSGGHVCTSCGCADVGDGVGSPSEIIEAGASRLSTFAPIGSCPDPLLARMIDHTLLKAEATEKEVAILCEEAAKHCFMSVCVNPTWVAFAARQLRGTGVKVCTVIGFPLGATTTRVKELETRVAIEEGAGEVDMVVNIGALKSGNLRLVENDIAGVVRATRGTVISKVILETGLLTNEEIIAGCKASEKAGAHFVKTSTGFAKKGASVEAVRLMRKTVGADMGVKASGGIRDHETALNMIGAGASRIGASASVEIVTCNKQGGAGY